MKSPVAASWVTPPGPKNEDGGPAGKGVWAPAATGLTPSNEDEFMVRYLAGGLIRPQ